jgi:hypothetical protein
MKEHCCDHDRKREPDECGCCCSLGRRDFLTGVSASFLVASSAMMNYAAAAMADTQPEKQKDAKQPRVRVVFMRPDVDQTYMGWPGASYDYKARQADYTKVMEDAAKKEGVQLDITAKPLATKEQLDALLKECTASPPAGVILVVMNLNGPWPQANDFVDKRPADLPVIVFSPMGTSFTGHLQPTRNKPKTFVAATQKYEWLAEGVHMMRTIWDMDHSRLCIVNGDKTEDKKLTVIGTTLHHIPLARWLDEWKAIGFTDEMKKMAAYYKQIAKKVVEPNDQDILNAAQTYAVGKRIMAAENCDGISLNCLGLVGERKIPCPPCLGWLRLNDEGSVGCCECDWNAAITLRLTSYLCRRPGFMQDPCPNTIAGTLMAAHCSSPTKLRGFDQPGEPLILRSHSESAIGVSPQVLWPVDADVTVAAFHGPEALWLGRGKLVANIDTPPSGGCRTSIEIAMDDCRDPRDVKGFHQAIILGDVTREFQAYGELAGIKVEPMA